MWLRNIYHVHQRLSMAFPSAQQLKDDPHFLTPYRPENFSVIHAPRSPETNFLYRIDPGGSGKVKIIVRSALEPNWDYAFHNAEFLLVANLPPIVYPCKLTFSPNKIYSFELVANPTRKIATLTKSERLAQQPVRSGVTKNGKRVPVAPDQWVPWLQKQAQEKGFQLCGQPQVSPFYYRFRKTSAAHEGKILTVRYRGLLKVIDPNKFEEALVSGIGPAKGFGCGLLTLSENTSAEAAANERERQLPASAENF
ncbi:MAG: type I-E CRISPR-associated protein Cas6/Cse3/CasE, partial [Candidatus Sumerlaeaceae bacterium]|nr:type I-E CRISPR-associated protein Cas6/Cse3/CasE [Candidatus Sumerlaeaceae bacterium]